LVFNFLIQGDDDELSYALTVIQHNKYPQLIPTFTKFYQERHPSTNQNIKVDKYHKAFILLALGLIGTVDAGKAIASLADANQVDFMLGEIIPIFGTYAAGVCNPSPESAKFILQQFSNYNMLVKHFACETLKRNGNISMYRELLDFALSDLNLADDVNVGYFGSSKLGKAISLTQFAVGTHKANRISALMNILTFSKNPNPSLLNTVSTDIRRCWSQLKRIDVIESIVRKNGFETLNPILPSIKKNHEKFLVACVIARIYPDPKDWLNIIISPINGPWLTTPVASRLTAYDTIVRLSKKNESFQSENIIQSGFHNSNPIIRSCSISTIIIHQLEKYYPDVLKLTNDPNKDVRISLVYSLILLKFHNPQLADGILKSMSNKDNDNDVRKLSERALSDQNFVQSVQQQL